MSFATHCARRCVRVVPKEYLRGDLPIVRRDVILLVFLLTFTSSPKSPCTFNIRRYSRAKSTRVLGLRSTPFRWEKCISPRMIKRQIFPLDTGGTRCVGNSSRENAGAFNQRTVCARRENFRAKFTGDFSATGKQRN